MSAQFYSIGHSTRSIDEFVSLLKENNVEQVVDVRRLRGSSRYPHFNEQPLTETLRDHDIMLRHLEAFAGRRPVSTTVPFEVNVWWQNRSFHNYADHALSDEFREALSTLLSWGAANLTALMCAEAVWWRCHRRIITDHLLAAGSSVTHILGKDQLAAASLSSGAVLQEDGGVRYPARV